MIIDMHTHIAPESFPLPEGRLAGAGYPRTETADGGVKLFAGSDQARMITDVCWNPDSRARALAGLGVDKQVLSPLPSLLMHELDPEDGAVVARHLNETIATMVKEEPDRFYGLGTAPLQDVELGVTELRRVKELGLLGVEIRTNIAGASLGEQRFRPFFQECVNLDLAVFVHASNPTFADRLAHLPTAIADAATGFPIECALAGASIIWGGLLADLPDLRICLSHGGGALMQTIARGDDTYRKRKPVQELLPEAPMEYARRMWYDDLTFGLDVLKYLVDHAGAGQVVIGSDYSGGGPKDPAPEVEFDALGLSASEREMVSSGNALRFLNASA